MMSPEAMPKAFQAVGVLTPNRWFIDGAAIVRDGRFPWAAVLVLAASGVALMALAVLVLRRRDIGVTHETHRVGSSTSPGTISGSWSAIRSFFSGRWRFLSFSSSSSGSFFKAERKRSPVAELTVVNLDQGRWGAYFIEKIKSPGIGVVLAEKEPAAYNRLLVLPPNFRRTSRPAAARPWRLRRVPTHRSKRPPASRPGFTRPSPG